MPILFICFIVFIMWFRVKSKQGSKNSVWDKAYWQKEHDANFARKQDLSDLEYLEIPLQELPLQEDCSQEEKEIQNNLQTILLHPILNLNGMSNADIKLTYGIANFEQLSACDQNYTKLIRTLNQWGVYCFETEDYTRSKQILEFAIQIGSDISATYLTLARIYLQEDSIEKIQTLINQIDSTDSFMKDSIKTRLTQIIREY